MAAGLRVQLERAAAKMPESPGQMMWVTCPRAGIDVGTAVGLADRRTGEVLTDRHTVKVASIGKSFTATAALRLIEDGAIDLDAPLCDSPLPEAFRELLLAHGYDSSRITVHHLLGHSSGLPDYADQPDGAYTQAVRADPMHTWTAEEQVRFALERYAQTGSPGEHYAYSDTGYLLVAQVVQAAAGQPLATAVRQLVDYRRGGLHDTYLELLEPAPSSAPRATQYVGEHDITHAVSATVDLFGGGGQVASMRDVAHFYRYIVTGQAFRSARTVAALLTPISPEEPSAGLGVFHYDLDGVLFIGHSGAWGLLAGYSHALDLGFAHSWNQMVVDDLEPLREVRRWVIGQLS